MVRVLSTLFFGMMLLLASPAGAVAVREVRMAQHEDFTRVVIELGGKTYYRIVDLSGKNNSLVVEVFSVHEAPSSVNATGKEVHAFSPQVRFDQQKRWFQVRVKTNGPVSYKEEKMSGPYRIVLDISPQSDGSGSVTPSAPASAPAAGNSPAKATASASANGAWRRRIIIDPGHGGYHKGGWGKLNGRTVYEKEVTIRVAEKMERYFMADPRFEVKLTRRDDKYYGLRERTQIASKLDGDLFMSLHCNAVEGAAARKRARGFEIWTWNRSGSKSAAAKAMEKIENADPGVSNNNNRILSAIMYDALEAQALHSKRFAEAVLESVTRDPYFKKHDRGVDEARFTVLEVYDMPSILVEMGFMSHPQEVKLLFDPNHQEKLARLLYQGVVNYYEKHDPTFPSMRSVASR